MTANEFQHFWSAVAGMTFPVSYLFKWEFSERWFRIHSLPESKRYPETPAEWRLLLQRQGTVLSDLLGRQTQILLLTGYYTHDEEPLLDAHDFLRKEPWFSGLSFTPLPAVDLHSISPDIYPAGTFYWPLLTEVALHARQIEPILRAVANEESGALFIGRESGTIVAPYDGGMDIILPTELDRDHYRYKYRTWLSARADGF